MIALTYFLIVYTLPAVKFKIEEWKG